MLCVIDLCDLFWFCWVLISFSNFSWSNGLESKFVKLRRVDALKFPSGSVVSALQVGEDNRGRMKAISCLKVPASVKMSEKLLKHTHSSPSRPEPHHRRRLRQLHRESTLYISFCYMGVDGRPESPVYFKTRIGKEHLLIYWRGFNGGSVFPTRGCFYVLSYLRSASLYTLA